MTITINVRYTGKENSVSFFLKEMKETGAVEEIRSLKGNQRYEYYWSLDDPQTVLLIHSWETQEDLEAYRESPMQKVIASLREKYDIRMTVERYVRAEDLLSDNFYGINQ